MRVKESGVESSVRRWSCGRGGGWEDCETD